MDGIYNTFSVILIGIFLNSDCQAVKPRVEIEVLPAKAVKIGGQINLTCRVTGTHVPNAVNWYHGDIQITPNTFLTYRNLRERYLLDSTVPGLYRINIIDARIEDSGLWRCVVEVANAVPPVQERRSTISVGIPDIYSITPRVEISVHTAVRLECNVTGEPEPIVKWRRIGPLSTLPNGQMSQTGSILEYRVRKIEDGGVFECQATNPLGTHRRTVPVNVRHAPVVEEGPPIVRGWLNIPVNITCGFDAYPEPSVSWYHNSIMVIPSEKRRIITTSSSSVLMLNPVTTDFGKYECRVSNPLGHKEYSVEFQPAVPPLPPVNIRIGSLTHSTLVLLFDSPGFDGGLPIKTYKVVYKTFGKTKSLSKRFYVGQNTILTNLTPSTMYIIKIAAGNAVGYGNFSKEQNMSTRGQLPPVEPTSDGALTKIPKPGATKKPDVTTGTAVVILPTKSGDKKESTIGQNAPMAVAIVVGSLVALFMGGILILIVSSLPAFKWRRNRHSELLLHTEQHHLCHPQQRSFVSDKSFMSVRTDLTFRPMSVLYDELGGVSIATTSTYFENEFPRHRLKVGSVIGTGSFGEVLRAEAIGIIKDGVKTTVALKTLKDNASSTDHQDFLKELGVMKQLKPHPNIVTLFGCCTEGDGPVYIVMEYLPNGNLLMHLRNSRQRIENMQTNRASIRTSLSPNDIIRYAYEIANGMSYLANMMCIHRDLAARNILLSRDGVCKLSDFGLARDVVDSGVYQRKTQGRVPIRWMALESLLDNCYTIQSDIWSFGILLWEVVTIGSYPYPGMSSKKLIRDLQRGYRMPKPEHCRTEVYDIMTACWQADQIKRPSFDELRKTLESILIESRNYLILDFDECLYDYAYGGSSDMTNTE